MLHRAAIAGLAAGLLAACPKLAPYVCEGDGDCDRGGDGGRCLDDGACAYPSGDCDSGWVRSPNAGDGPDECVVLDPSGSTDTTNASSSTTTTQTTGVATSATTSDDTGPQPSCGQQVRLEIDTDFLSTTEVLDGYPLLVVIEDDAIVAALAAAASDPAFVTTDGAVLAADIERLDADAPQLVAWVKLPAYSLGEPLPITLRIDGDTPAGDSTATWSDRWVGVWHMAETPSGVAGDEIRNSASAADPAVLLGAMAPEQSVPGPFGRALQLDGVDDVIEIDGGFVGTLDSYSLSMWMRYDDKGGDRGHFFYRLNGDYHYPRCWRFGDLDGSDEIFCQYQLEGGDPIPFLTDATQAVGQLVHLAIVRDATAAMHRVYIDGELASEQADTAGAALVSGDRSMLLGMGEDDISLDGMIDEVRVADVPISSSWIRADVRTKVDPSAAVKILGSIEPVPASECAG